MASTSQAATSSALDLFDNIVRCETRLYNSMNDTLRARHGIVTTQFEFLRYLRDHADPRIADMSAHFAIGVGAASKGIDRLQSKGWMQRVPNPADRRSSLLTLTPAGKQLVDDAERTFESHTTGLIAAALLPAQVTAATVVLSALRAALEQEQVGVPVG